VPIHVGEGSGGLVEIAGVQVGNAAGGLDEIAKVWEYRSGVWVELWAPAAGVPSQTATFTAANTTAVYQPPAGATRLVMIALGAGGAGGTAEVDERSNGGEAGKWAGLTLYAPFLPQYYVYVGVGASSAGQASRISDSSGVDAVRILSAAGGRAGAARSYDGASPGSYNYGGVTRYGGTGGKGYSHIWGDDATAPGAGGGGAGDDNSGGRGSRGQVWITAFFD